MNRDWLTASGACALALGLFAAGPVAAEISYTYVELDYVDIDVDISESVVDTDVDARLSTDNDGGFRLGGSWQFYDNWHVFGEFSNGENDISIDGTVLGVPASLSGEFDITRWRLGVGYGFPVNEDLSVYGRFSYDYIEFDEFDISGLDDDGDLDTDDNGLGVEGGVRWMAAAPFEVQGYVRYTSVGEVDVESEDEFDDDFLFGVGARYYFFDNRLGVQAGYEVGEINTWNIGGRWQF